MVDAIHTPFPPLLRNKIDQCKPMELRLSATRSILLQWRRKSPGKPYPITKCKVVCVSFFLLLRFACVQRSVGHFGQRLGSQKSAVGWDVLHARTNNYSSVEMAPVQGETPKKQRPIFVTHMNTVENFKNLG